MTDEQLIYVNDELFLGRIEEQTRFREVLRAALTGHDPPEATPYIFLIYGQGGMGKSQLTRRLYDIATQEPPFERDAQALRLDWEQVRHRDLNLRPPRDQIHPEAVLAALHRAALDEGWGHCFQRYRQVVKQRAEAEQAVAKALEQEHGQSRYSELRDLTAGGLAKLVRQALPAIGQTGEDLTRSALSATVQVGAEGAAALRARAEQFLTARLQPEQYEIYRQPHEQLARALGQGFRRVSQSRPLVLLLDTYEIVAASVDPWLRTVIKSGGPRVIWLLAGRDDLSTTRSGDRFSLGYSADFPERLFRWDMQELAVKYVSRYLADQVPDRPPSPEEAAALHRATLGVPLALKQAADLWRRGAPLAAITQGTPDYAPREELVRLMCDRVLLHVDDDPSGQADRQALYALAMQPRPDPEILAAVLRPETEGEAAFDLRTRLAELAGRYSAVQQRGGGQLHAVMGDFVQEYLLRTEARLDGAVAGLAGRAVTALRARRARQAQTLFDLAERLESDDWQQTSLDLLHWLFWQEELAAWRELIPRFVEGLGYDRAFARSLLKTAEQFKPALSQDGRRRLKTLQADLLFEIGDVFLPIFKEERDTLLTELERLAHKGHWLDDDDPPASAERRAILRLWRGRWQLAQAQPEAAFQTLRQAQQQLPPEAAGLRSQVGRAFYELSGKLLWPAGATSSVASQPGLSAAQRAVQLDEKEGSHWYNLGVALDDLGQKTEAEEAYRRAIELDEGYATPWNGLGNVYWAQGRYEEAEAAYRRAIELDEGYAYPWNGLGNVYVDQGRYEEAEAAYRRAIALDEGVAYPWNGLGNVYRAQGRNEEAEAAYRRAIELDEGDAYPWNGLGNVYGRQGRNEEAEAAYRRAIELDEGDAYPWNGLGNVYRAQGRNEEAEAAYRRAIELDEGAAYPWHGLGNVYRAQGRNEEAEAAYRRAIELDEGDATPWNGLGNVYRAQGRNEEAEAAYRRAIELDEGFSYPWNGLGTVYRAQGRNEEAEAAYQRAIELDEGDALPWNGLGNVYDDQGWDEEAEAAYRRALELDPRNPYVYNNLAGVYLDQGQLDKARAHYQKRVDLSPANALSARVTLGIIARRQGDETEAANQFETALALWDTAWGQRLQTPAGLLENKALAQLGLGQSQAALAILKEALAQRLPGDQIQFQRYDLLAAAPTPPPGLAEMRRLLEESMAGDSDSDKGETPEGDE